MSARGLGECGGHGNISLLYEPRLALLEKLCEKYGIQGQFVCCSSEILVVIVAIINSQVIFLFNIMQHWGEWE